VHRPGSDLLPGLARLTVSISDTAPTTQAAAVAKEVMARVDAEIGKVEWLVTTEIAAVNRLALEREVAAQSAD
jgi:hypothetical protein